MDCPLCGTELDRDDVYGRLCAHQDGKVIGDIYRCPKGREQDGTCDSESFSVAGSFYVVRETGEIHEGYPC